MQHTKSPCTTLIFCHELSDYQQHVHHCNLHSGAHTFEMESLSALSPQGGTRIIKKLQTFHYLFLLEIYFL